MLFEFGAFFTFNDSGPANRDRERPSGRITKQLSNRNRSRILQKLEKFPTSENLTMSSSATATSQLTKSAVTLKGSAQIVAEFFDYGINSILYQRGIYPPGM